MNEEMLSGLDGPRPLPPALRQQLEDRLLSDASRPLEPEMAGRLASALGAEPSGARLPRFTRARVGAAAAVAGLLIAGSVTVALDHPGRARPAAVSGSSTSSSPHSLLAPVPSGAGAGAAAGSPAPSAAGASAPSFNASNAQLNQSSAAAAPAGPLDGVAATVTPDRGPAAGGTWVTITGAHLTGATGVRFGSRLAPRYTVVSGEQIRALTPPGPPGPVPVSVLAAPGESSLGPFPSFTYTSPRSP